jgi:hypothetical protein
LRTERVGASACRDQNDNADETGETEPCRSA